ncbi:aminoglycoside phosphotransferase family protein [Anaerobacillus alkaliphilus]|uniref:Aminoglycoside phosphotransferase family protein n=1 Tax=Anaerobacillus alkaliphilus TaxID=1548597 RepID=A0A4Q0VY47_9BACI|nr:aminoglycoside phosphotransferase family protein [Anaerobacillus alkaliphilus]
MSSDIITSSTEINEITKGFSHDKKYVVNGQYLVRIFPQGEEEKRKEEFNCIQTLSNYSQFVPKTYEFGHLADNEFSYMILEFLPGDDAESVLPQLSGDEQYEAGFLAGKELKKLHQLHAPESTIDWFTQKKKKSDNYLEELQTVPVDDRLKELLATYIKQHEHLMRNRPNTFQHDDFHPSNLLIHNKVFSGIIDFQRMDWGDPLHDLTKIGFFSKRISVEFSRGVLEGYHSEEGISEVFWELYSLYSAMHIVSAIVWGLRMSQEQFETLLGYSLDVLADHDDFKQTIPKWYKNK